MNLIAIETATENCAVALSKGSTTFEKQLIEPRKHAELMLPLIDQLLQEAQLSKCDIEGIVFGHGPGAFTGVRIAIGVVQGLALAWQVPVWGVSTLDNMAQGAWLAGRRGSLQVVNDARMNEVYTAVFELTEVGVERRCEDALKAPEAIETAGFDWVIGNGLKAYPEILKASQAQMDAEALPNASNLLSLAAGRFEQMAYPVHQISPHYVRNQVVRA